ncbi:MAG: amidohydrolase family protein [Pyrinomonadaceae bacterium]
MSKKVFVIIEIFLLLAQTVIFAQTEPSFQSKLLVINHVTVIDTVGGAANRDMTVVITNGRISKLGKNGTVKIPKNAQVIEATGKFLIPGLWDMHTHLSFYADTKEPPFTAFPALLSNGVTGARDLGSNLEQIDRWRKDIGDGTLVGPRIFRAGPYVDGPKKMNEFRAALTIVVNTPDEARAAVKKLKERGADFIKVHNAVPHDAYLALADECRKQKISLATHLPRSVRIEEASDAGTGSIEHIELILESVSFDVKAGEKPKDPLAALAEITDEKANALFARFVKNKTYYAPTLVGYRSFVQEAEEGAVKDPAKWRNSLAARQKIFARFKEFVGMMQKSGVKILAGTDFARKREAYPYPVPQPGTDLHDELALFVESGLTPLEALQTATLNPAKWLNIQKDYGTIEKGKVADLVLLDANPLDDIKNTRKISAVIIGGKIVSQANSTIQPGGK